MDEKPNRENTIVTSIILGIYVIVFVVLPLLASLLLFQQSKRDDKTESLARPAVISEKKSSDDPDRYYVTFKLDDGQSITFLVGEKVYGQMNPGEQGELRYQGTRFAKFTYSSPVFTDWGVVSKNELNPDYVTAGKYEQYFIRIQLNSGESIELKASSMDSTWASWGQFGRVTYQGTRLTSFRRTTERSQGDIPSRTLSVVAQSDPRRYDIISLFIGGIAALIGLFIGIFIGKRKHEREQA